jgi:drug/metabolite transporter (DMT)-like permease
LAFKNNLKIFIIMGAVFWVHWITYFLAIKGSSASYGLLGLSTYGIQLSLISAYIAKQHLSKTNKLSLGIIFIGLVLIQNPFAAEFTWNTGLVWGTISAFFYALIPILHKKHVEIPLQHRVFGMFSTTAFFFLLLTPLGNWGQLGVNDLYLLLFLGIGGTFIAHTLWVNYTTVNPGWVSGLLYYQVIPITLLLNYLINDENHSLSKILGSVLLLFANLISILKSNSKKKL